jgi:Putative peptidoglycan binding domain
MRRVLFLGTALALFGATMAEAADSKERFQAYGLGRLTCKRFVEACDAKKDDCQVVAPTWFEGYLTGFNALFDDTYDILPWQPPGILAEFTLNVCRQNPDALVLQVANDLIRQVFIPDRIKTASDRVRIGEGKDAVAFYRETIRSLQQRLVDMGFLKGGVDGSFGPGTKAGVEAFQKANGLPATGIPDMRTMLAAFYGRPQAVSGNPPQAQREPAAQAPAAQAPAGQPPAKLDLNLGGPTLQ